MADHVTTASVSLLSVQGCADTVINGPKRQHQLRAYPRSLPLGAHQGPLLAFTARYASSKAAAPPSV